MSRDLATQNNRWQSNSHSPSAASNPEPSLPQGILPEVLLYRILEFAEPPPVNRRATSWASMREEDSKEEDEGVESVWVEEVAREIVSQPKRVREAAPFVSGHGQVRRILRRATE